MVHLDVVKRFFVLVIKAGAWPYNSKNIIGFISSTYEELKVGTKEDAAVLLSR